MSKIKDLLYGVAIGDAFGLPYEDISRFEMNLKPANPHMIGGGVNRQEAGTWSDDTSLSLALASSIADLGEYNKADVTDEFDNWLNSNAYTCAGEVFDVGNTTRAAINNGYGNTADYCNGNGSLMRILPLALYLKDEDSVNERWKAVVSCSSITHAHIRSILACFFLVEFARLMINSTSRSEYKMSRWFQRAHQNFKSYLNNFAAEKDVFTGDYFGMMIHANSTNHIKSGTYVIETLQAVMYCLFHTTNYEDCVTMAVNLGDDTDTTAAIVGGLAGIFYSSRAFPIHWLNKLRGKEQINDVIERWNNQFKK